MKKARTVINACLDKRAALIKAAAYPAYWAGLSAYIEQNFP